MSIVSAQDRYYSDSESSHNRLLIMTFYSNNGLSYPSKAHHHASGRFSTLVADMKSKSSLGY